MSDRTTINVTKEAHQAAKAAKEDDENWSEYLQRCIDNPPANPGVDTSEIAEALKDEISMTAEPSVDPNTEEMMERVERLEGMVQEAVDAAQRAEKAAEELQR